MNISVLLFSDDPSVSDLLPAVLSGRRFDLKIVTGVEEALQNVASIPPQIVVVDLASTEIDARQACRAIRLATNVPILVLSALNAPSVVARLLDAGADDYLVKPVPVSVLLAHLRKLARQTGALHPDQSGSADWVRDTQPIRP